MQQSADFSNATIHDLMANDSFVAWVKRPTSESDAFWQEVQAQHPSIIPIVNEARQLIQQLIIRDDSPDEGAKERSLQRFRQSIIQEKKGKVKKINFLRIAATVSIFLVAGIWGWYYQYKGGHREAPFPDAGSLQAEVTEPRLRIKGQPDILLKKAGKGRLVQVGNQVISKESADLLIFSTAQSSVMPKPGEWVQINLPRTIRYRLELADGSKVWLNAASAIRFPADFESQRQIELEGEAYFEVVQNAASPFEVSSGDLSVNVLGTNFNVSNYQSDPSASVTLLGGAVSLQHKQGKAKKLIPGQQAYFDARNVTEPTLKTVNTKEAVAWKDGLFAFHQDSISHVMDKLSHWYDIRISYEAARPTVLFSGTIPCETPIQDVLGILEEAGGVKFIRNGRYITVRSKP